MAKWVSAYEKQPLKNGIYFAKCNGEKKLIYSFDFQKEMDRYDTFLWLDETVEIEEILEKIRSIDNIDDFCKFDRHELSEHFLTPYTPLIPKSIVLKSFHKYYLRIIASLRQEISFLRKNNGKELPQMFKENKVSEKIKPIYKESLMDKILKENSFF